jgi:laminin G domain protein
MKIRRLIVVLAASTAVLACTSGTASAAADYPVAIWAMDEPAGSRTMHDSSGNGLNGRIGDEVGVGSHYDGALGFRFPRLEPDTPPTHPGHLIVVPSSDLLNPGSGDFAVTMRLRTIYQFGNIVQKGQATVPGGSWKLQIPNGHVQCWFRGSAGQVLVTGSQKINDGRWHVIRCERTDGGVSLTIDGRTAAGKYGPTGRIANNWPLSIGGKTECDQRSVGCDYFAGDLDYVAIER